MQLSGEETYRSSMNGWMRAGAARHFQPPRLDGEMPQLRALTSTSKGYPLIPFTPEEDKGELSTR